MAAIPFTPEGEEAMSPEYIDLTRPLWRVLAIAVGFQAVMTLATTVAILLV